MDERLIEVMASGGKICPHVHLPLQSGSDRILAAMQRTYTIDSYRDIVRRLRAAVPGIAITTDIIVGFPGETEEDFQRTADVLAETRYDSAFLFKYSARPDTRAWRWPETVSEEEKGARLTHLIEQQHQISGELHDASVGREVEVLVEGPARKDSTQLFGKSAHFRTVVFEDDGTAAGSLRRVRVVGATPVTLLGESLRTARGPDPSLVQIR
jgi:tRNA-2-methylthio-N6-dimethylallyladenosine synthase